MRDEHDESKAEADPSYDGRLLADALQACLVRRAERTRRREKAARVQARKRARDLVYPPLHPDAVVPEYPEGAFTRVAQSGNVYPKGYFNLPFSPALVKDLAVLRRRVEIADLFLEARTFPASPRRDGYDYGEDIVGMLDGRPREAVIEFARPVRWRRSESSRR